MKTIRQMHERGLDLAEVLMDLEEDELLRLQVIEALGEVARVSYPGVTLAFEGKEV